MRLPEELLVELGTSGVPWELERGKKHYKLRVGGRMVGILPLSGKLQTTNKVPLKNTLAQVRRAIRDIQGEQ